MIDNLTKIWTIFTQAERRRAAWMLMLVVAMALVETLGVLSIMPFLSVLGRPTVIHESAILNQVYDWLGFRDTREFTLALGLISIVTVITSSAFKAVTLHLLNRFVHLVRHSMSARLLSRYLHQPYEFFLVRHSAILTKNVLSEVDQLAFELIQPVSQLIAQGAVVLAMTVLILCYDPWMAACIVATLGLLYGAIYISLRKRFMRIGTERQVANGRRYLATNEAFGGIKDVKITRSASAYQTQFERASRLFSRHMAATDTLSQSPLYLVEAIGYGMLIGVAIALLLRSSDIAEVLPALGLYGFAAYRMLPAAQVMYRGFAKLRVSSSALQTIHDDFSLPYSWVSEGKATLAPHREIRLKDIRYAYPSTPEKLVFDGLDLTIQANSSIGIAGKSGAGKSTLLDIMLGLLRPQSGTLTVDGTTIDASNVAEWQRAVGYVPQHIFLVDATVAENIAFGVEPNDIDAASLERAAKAAQIHDFIVGELPQGYSTGLGERGVRLSGGQRQRIGIARALYHDPAVLIMDEATNALDRQTEECLNSTIRALSGDKTVIVVSHRESSLRYCDKVVSITPHE